MSSRGVKLVWGAAKQVPGRWRLGLWGVYEKPAGVRRMAISVRGLLGWGAGASVAVYLAAATALYFWFARQPHNLVTWTDTLLMPVRWEHVRELRGRMMIAQGLEDLAAQRWAEAHMKLRVGLVRAPHEVEGRRALADFYLLANRRADAIAVLTGDLASGYPGRTFLAKVFTLAAEGEDFDLIIAACERFAGHADDREWLLGQRIGALLGAKRAEEALQLANTHPGEGGVAVKEGKALALLELGRAEEAAAFLETWAQGNREAAPQLAGLQARAYGQLKRWPEMDAALECVRQAAPLDPRSYLEAVVQTWRVGRETAAKEALERFFRRFGGSASHLAVATAALVEASAPGLVERCVDEAAQQGFALGPFKLHMVQARLDARDWDGAARALAEAQRAGGAQTPTDEFVRHWLEELVGVVTGEAPGARLMELAERGPLPFRLHRQTCEALVRAGRYDAAESLLRIAERSFPTSRRWSELRAETQRAAMPTRQTSSTVAPAEVSGTAFSAKIAEAP